MKSLIALLAVVVLQDGRAQESRKFYVGAAVGYSHLNPDITEFAIPADTVASVFYFRDPIDTLDDPTDGWKVVAGWRSGGRVGGEVTYVDFGDTRVVYFGNTNRGNFETGAEAIVLSAIFYVPDQSSSFDFYGKVGVASLERTFDGSIFTSNAPGCGFTFCTFNGESDETDTNPIFGVGARFSVDSSVDVRVEFESIDRNGDNPTLLSVGLAWQF